VTDLTGRGGRTLSADEIKTIESWLGARLPDVVVALLTENPLVGLNFTLDDEDDESGLGAELKWMNSDEMLSEATEAYPGLVACPLGYLPVGICLEGSGDPYFLRLDDAALVRVPHDAVGDDGLNEDAVEVVLSSIAGFVGVAEPD
jgi:hypothetical protein